MTIADVITGDGTKVTKHALDLSCLSRASSKWDWPNECPCNKDILRWRTGLKRLTSENLSFPFSLRLDVGYSHHILTGNGSTNDAIAFSTTQQIMHVMFFAPFPQGLRWPSDVSRSFLHYQCHIMSWSELRFDMNVAVYCLRGLQLMPIQRSQSTTQFTSSTLFSN